MDKLVQFKRKLTKNSTALFEAWDFGYYAGKYDEKVLGLDESTISDFFPSERVVAKTQEIYQNLLGLTFKQILNPSVWHKDVTMYEVKDTAT
jgi:thimet oligopeptidase